MKIIIMEIITINYKARVLESTEHLTFREYPPQQACIRTGKCTIVIFRSGKCRIMGCKEPLATVDDLPIRVRLERIQSVSVKFDVGTRMNVQKIANTNYRVNPELFPAARLVHFNPLSVNLFSSGKVIVMGLKGLDNDDIIDTIKSDILANIQDQLTTT